MVEQLAQQVAIPPHAEVGRYPHPTDIQCRVVFIVLSLKFIGIFLGMGHHLFALDIAYALAVATPHLPTRVFRVYVGSHTAPHIILTFYLEDDLTRGSIAQRASVSAIFVALPHLQFVRIRTERCEVQCIAMPHASVI